MRSAFPIVATSLAVLATLSGCAAAHDSQSKSSSVSVASYSASAGIEENRYENAWPDTTPKEVVDVYGETLEMPTYSQLVSSIDEYMGKPFFFSERVTQVSGAIRSENYMVYAYYDDSETYGEVVAIRIPRKEYTESVNRHIDAHCRLEGLDDNGHPQFLIESYTAV